MPDELIALRANAPQFDAAKGAEGLPKKLLVLAWGEHDTAQGKVICDDATMKQLSAYNASKNWDRIALDFEHNSVPASPTYAGEPVKIAGYGKLELVKGEGIYLLMSSWTPEGKDFAAGGHYGDLSPVVKVNKENEVIGLHSVALCRHGATPGLTFLSALPAVQHAPPAKPARKAPIQKPSKKTKAMADATPPQTPEELFAALKGVLNLGADATAADILAAISKAVAAKAEPDDDDEEDKGETKALSAEFAELKKLLLAQDEKLKLLSSGLETNDRTAVLAQAAREGKVVPKSMQDLPVEKLKLLCAELPVTVPLEKRTPEATLMLSSGAPGYEDPELAKIDKLTGVTADMRKKYA